MNHQRILVGIISIALGTTLVGCATPTAKSSDAVSAQQQPGSAPNSSAQTKTAAPKTSAIDAPPAPPQPSPSSALADQTLAAKPPGHPHYANAKSDFSYGPGQPWPKLMVPTKLIPGPLASAPGGRTVLAITAATAIGITPTRDVPVPEAVLPSPCANELAASSLDIGPKEAWLSRKLKSAVIGALGKALFGFGRSDDYNDEPDAPPTVADPISASARQTFHDRISDTEMSIAGKLTDQGLLLSTGIESAPDKSTFHAIYIERKDCQRTFPDRYLNYRIWLEWSLSVSWTKTKSNYQNDNLVSQTRTSGGFFDSGEINLAEGSVNLADAKIVSEYQQGLLKDLPAPIWQQMGFSSPTSGVRDLGSQFDKIDTATLFNGDSVAVVHVTRVVDGRYVTRALPFTIQRGVNNLLTFTRL